MGKYTMEDMSFAFLWNCNEYEPDKRNYSLRKMVYRTPAYMSVGDEYGGSDNSRDESIELNVNVEEGVVFLDSINQARKIFKSDLEIERFVNLAERFYREKLDMGKEDSKFIFGAGGTKACLHGKPNFERGNNG